MKKGFGDQKVAELIVKIFLRKYSFSLKYSEKMIKSLTYIQILMYVYVTGIAMAEWS